MAYNERETAILKKYHILDPNGNVHMTNLKRPTRDGVPALGEGPLLAPDAVNRLIAADTTPDQRWLDWIFHQAAGGDEAMVKAEESFDRVQKKFTDKWLSGFTHDETGTYYPPVSKKEADARWARKRDAYRYAFIPGTQDQVDKFFVYGFFRNWPGQNNRYENVVAALTHFLRRYPDLMRMNAELKASGAEPLPTEPKEFKKWEDLKEVPKKVERYFAAKTARKDVRTLGPEESPMAGVELPVYEDDNVTAIIPLTHAAAVRYGYEGWPWAGKEHFEKALTDDPAVFSYKNQWRDMTRGANFKGVVYINFKAPVPAWVSRKGGNWSRFDYTDLAIPLDDADLKEEIGNWTVNDQENRTTSTVDGVISAILSEPTRQDPAEGEEAELSLRPRGKNVYSTEEEAQKVATSLTRALEAVKRRLLKGDFKVKSDPLTMDD